MSKLNVTLLGLGIMGTGMAGRLLANGFPLTVYNRNAQKAADLTARGARTAASPREAAAQADVILSMVSDDHASRALWLGENGALAGARPGTVCIECSTVTVSWVRELATAVAAVDSEFLDAPVAGSKMHAAAGELTFLVGGTLATLDKVRPVLAAMSKAAVHLGPTGSGSMVKLINNFMCGVQIAALAEAMTMVERSGLDRVRALEVLTNGSPGSPLVKMVATRMMTPDYTPNFYLQLMAKDLAYATQEAGLLSIELTTALAASSVFHVALDAGLGEKDISAVIEPMRQKVGTSPVANH